MRDIMLDKIEGTCDLVPIFAGEERCKSNHSYGPHVRKHYLLHYCLSGRGVLRNKGGEHPVEAGELFIIRPGEVTTYTADASNPWHYVWLGFSGSRAEIFSADSRSVYPCSADIFDRLLELIEADESSPDIYTALLYEILYKLFSASAEKQDAISKIRRYIRYNYMEDITADSISRLFGYERTYLYRIFKKRYGTGIKDYLIKVRMENAKSFLAGGASVCDTARMTGYRDEFNFSKAYKKYYGIPPSYARKEIINP